VGAVVASEPSVDGIPVGLDEDSARWVGDLAADGRAREAAIGRLHEMLLRVARNELRRRGGALRIAGPELDDLAYQATADAVVAITAKLSTFRGESRFTTWAYRFVILEVSSKVGRHFWRHPSVSVDVEQWDQLPDRFGADPACAPESRELAGAIRRAVDEDLTDRQRRVFVAIVLQGIPLDALVVELASSRNAIYKTLFDARRKLREVLAANGYLADHPPRHP
jgi:RNA polymerase sigma-70 factor (ECF subfamily)